MASDALFRHSTPPRRRTGGPSPKRPASSTAWRLAGATMAALAMGTLAGLAMPTRMKAMVGEDWRRNIPRHFAADYTADTTMDDGMGGYLVPPGGEVWSYPASTAYAPAADAGYALEPDPVPPSPYEAEDAALAAAQAAPVIKPPASGPRVIDLTAVAPAAGAPDAAASPAQVAALR